MPLTAPHLILARFNQLHHEKLPSAQERYGNEVLCVVGVLNSYLKAHGKQYLVGDKCTYADLAFVCWNVSIDWSLTNGPIKWDIDAFPEFKAWMERLKARPAVGKSLGHMFASKEVKSEGDRKE